MPNIEIIQQLIYSIAVALFLVYISQIPKISLFLSSLLFVLLLMGINFIPMYHGNSLIELLRGVVGDLSVASGGLLLLIMANQFEFSKIKKPVLNGPEKFFLMLLGGALYLSTFGFISFDLYHLGYLAPQMLLFFSSVTLGLIMLNRRLGYIWLISVISFYFRLQASNNLWDYLYDPVLWAVLVVDMLMRLFKPKLSNWQG